MVNYECNSSYGRFRVELNGIKYLLKSEPQHSAFRFLTVDAYLSAVEFYRKNGFKELTKKDEDEHTRLMFFDMMNVE